jgi:sortase (surface protein transpeptidase)
MPIPYSRYFAEDINIPLSKGDIFLHGKFKNKKAVFDHIEKNEKGDILIVTDTGKKISLMKIRLVQEASLPKIKKRWYTLKGKEVVLKEGSWVKKQLHEELKLSDLKKHAGTSEFTNNFRKKRQSIIGSGAQSVKIKQIRVNRKKDYITFVFTSVPTYKKTSYAVAFPNVDQQKKVRAYTQEIRVLDFFKWAKTKPGYKEKDMTIPEIKEILNIASIQLSCNCKSFQFQGMNYILTTFDAAIYPETRPPKRWNQYHNDDNFVCKHLGILLTSGLNIYINNMTSMVNSYLQRV